MLSCSRRLQSFWMQHRLISNSRSHLERLISKVTTPSLKCWERLTEICQVPPTILHSISFHFSHVLLNNEVMGTFRIQWSLKPVCSRSRNIESWNEAEEDGCIPVRFVIQSSSHRRSFQGHFFSQIMLPVESLTFFPVLPRRWNLETFHLSHSFQARIRHMMSCSSSAFKLSGLIAFSYSDVKA